MTEVYGMSGIKAADLTNATLQCRRQAWDILKVFKELLPGFENAYIEQTAPVIGVRETRRIRALYFKRKMFCPVETLRTELPELPVP